ncbi:MAG: nucleotide pyrophosphohydrolase [Planctomycetaceae bacterium]|nr:nucleotide pyrophosphohydrolase [Planctomycetaceae bacterium]
MSSANNIHGSATEANISVADFQRLIEKMYGEKDRKRGVEGTFMWFMEEVGELATALREGKPEDLAGEFADVFAWLTTMANVANINLTQAIFEKYGTGCPGCQKLVCLCPSEEKP